MPGSTAVATVGSGAEAGDAREGAIMRQTLGVSVRLLYCALNADNGVHESNFLGCEVFL